MNNPSTSSPLPFRLTHPFSIGLLSPSGFVRDTSDLQSATRQLIADGHTVRTGRNAAGNWQYFSGTDTDRLSDIRQAATDPGLQVIIATRGGYGISRLMDRLPWDQMAASGKSWVGFSDFTLIHLGLLATTGMVSFAGPMAAVDLKNELSNQEGWHFLTRLLTEAVVAMPPITVPHPYSGQTIEGPIWGGCLSLLAAATGTPWMPDMEGGILFIEDVNEEPYRIERLLFQLYHAGILSRQKALLFGAFNHCEPGSGSAWPYTLDHVINHFRNLLPYPVLTGFPFGHVASKLAVPIGGQARLTIGKNGYKIRFSEYNR